MRSTRLFICLSLAGVSIPASAIAQPAPDASSPPPVAREFRASWVATVANIDWPSRPGLPSWQQQAELRAILDRAVALKMNAIVFQVRPAADALYKSAYEPWSEYLTGTQGLPPDPYYDPLELVVKEAHARGLELHAWFNPFRARHPTARSAIAGTHVSQRQPEIVRTYGRHLWLDPSVAAARRYSLQVIADVVRRYDVDGVHIDDYFYPYKERDSSGALIDFPDSAGYARYVRGGDTKSRDDWRRGSVDTFVREMYAEVKRIKPHVKVGISPFGIWRPGHPEQIRGFDAYAEIYADSRLWWRQGWLDYFAPQLYWPIAQQTQSFPVLLEWWASENVKKRHLWPGLYTSRVANAGNPAWAVTEIPEQIRLARANAGASGHIHFSEKALRSARETAMAAMAADTTSLASALRVVDSLRPFGARRDSMIAVVTQLYSEPALVPASPWLDRTPPAAPRATLVRDPATGGTALRLRPASAPDVRYWVIQRETDAGWTTTIRPGWERDVVLSSAKPYSGRVFVRAVDRTGNESRAVLAR